MPILDDSRYRNNNSDICANSLQPQQQNMAPFYYRTQSHPSPITNNPDCSSSSIVNNQLQRPYSFTSDDQQQYYIIDPYGEDIPLNTNML